MQDYGLNALRIGKKFNYLVAYIDYENAKYFFLSF